MDVLLDMLVKFAEAIWSATDPFGVAFGILGTYGFRTLDGSFENGDPVEKKDRTFIRRTLPVIPVLLGMSWVFMFTVIYQGNVNIETVLQRAVGTGCSALAVHKIWWHTIRNT